MDPTESQSWGSNPTEVGRGHKDRGERGRMGNVYGGEAFISADEKSLEKNGSGCEGIRRHCIGTKMAKIVHFTSYAFYYSFLKKKL